MIVLEVTITLDLVVGREEVVRHVISLSIMEIVELASSSTREHPEFIKRAPKTQTPD